MDGDRCLAESRGGLNHSLRSYDVQAWDVEKPELYTLVSEIFDENGAIGAIKDASTEGTYYPIQIRSLFIGDKTLGGLEAPDSNAIQWSFLPNWSDDLAIVVPAFNPLTDLKPAQK